MGKSKRKLEHFCVVHVEIDYCFLYVLYFLNGDNCCSSSCVSGSDRPTPGPHLPLDDVPASHLHAATVRHATNAGK
jgi:hypothetical protein